MSYIYKHKYPNLPKDIKAFGTMRTTWIPKPMSEEEAVEVFYNAYKAGYRLFNGGEFYGPDFLNLKYLQAFIDKYPEVQDEILISIKGCVDVQTLAPNNSEEFIEQSINNSLKYLKKIDIFESARVDPKVPIEQTIKTLSKFVEAGKIGGISLSESGAETIKRAAKVAKISCVELEFSLWTTDLLENGVAEVCKELDLPIIAYSPLGSGFFGGLNSKNLPEGDFRNYFDRFQSENHDANEKFYNSIAAIAKNQGLSVPQLALAWIKFFNSEKNPNRMLFPTFIPLPGSVNAERIKQNADIKEIDLETFNKIQQVLKTVQIAGGRYNSQGRTLLFA